MSKIGKTIIVILLVALFTGCWTTSNGEHVGYVSALEKTGVIWKTGLVYFKTELESSQEDDYCVIDQEVYDLLTQYQIEGVRVKMTYHAEMITAPWRCGMNNTIIDSVELIFET